MEFIKYILAVAIGAFAAGVGAITFIDGRIEEKLVPHVPKIEANTKHSSTATTLIDERMSMKLTSYLTKPQADNLYVKEPFSERLIELQRVVDTLGQRRDRVSFSVTNPRIGGTSQAACPEGSYVVGISASRAVGGKYAVDGISEITFTCGPLK